MHNLNLLFEQPIVLLRKNKEVTGVFDVELNNIQNIKKYYSEIEFHIVLYPYSRKIKATKYCILPFEEYVKDLLHNKRSAYTLVTDYANRWFGIFFGGIITLIFAFFNPNSFLAIDAIVSIFAAYFLGKDLWNEIERALIKLTQNFKLRFTEQYYSYYLERNTTLTNYTLFAKKHRYGKVHLLPNALEFIENSNSQTLRMKFNSTDLLAMHENVAHCFSIKFKKKIVENLENEGFMLGVKLSFNNKATVGMRHFEVFQSLHKSELGCLSSNTQWLPRALFYRKAYSLSRIKYFKNEGIINDVTLILEV